MDISLLLFALFTGVYYWFTFSVIGYTFSDAFFSPVVTGFVLGLILGDVSTGLILGATIQLIYIGIIGAGGNWPADECMATLICVPLAIKTGMSIEAAAALAVPLGLLGAFVNNVWRGGNTVLVHWEDKFAEKGDDKGVARCGFLYAMIWSFIITVPIMTVANYFGASLIEPVLDVIPEWIMHAFEIAGGVLPCLGIAMTIGLIGKKNNFALFFIAFFIVTYSGINIMFAAVMGVCLALLMVYNRNKGGAEINGK